MVISWDKTDSRIWLGSFGDAGAAVELYLVVENLPNSTDWDWAVWNPEEPSIVQRGIAASAPEAATAAEEAAASWSDSIWLGRP